jgi:ubiquinone/menaquinone biosynthesis C-methylase UbiE
MPFDPAHSSLVPASVGPVVSGKPLLPGALRLAGRPRGRETRRGGRLAALAAVFSGDEAVSAEEAYRRAAPVYDGFRWLWLRLGAASAERALLQAAADAIRPDARVLDAGAGTGQLARRLHRSHPDAHFTLLDISAAMLARAADVPGRRVLGSVTELPFPDRQFDVIVSGWVLETLERPARALEEFARVLAPGGRIVYSFCSRPSDGWRRGTMALTRRTVERRFAGSFRGLDPAIPRNCRQVDRFRGRAELATTITLERR